MPTPGREAAAPRRLEPDLHFPIRRVRGKVRRFSPGVVAIAAMLSVFHLLNYLNYTFLAGYFNPPATRSALLVLCGLFLLLTSAANLRFHLARSWDVYGICLIAMLSAAYSSDSVRTLQYAAWLLLAVYIATELSSRILTPQDIVAALSIVFLPATMLVAFANMTLGPVVSNSGRRFGALGSTHVDTAYAMDFICVLLALRAIPGQAVRASASIKVLLVVLLGWSLYQALFGLTRSVWLGVLLGLVLYYFRRRFTIGTLFATMIAAVIAAVVIDYVGLARVLPGEVQARLDVTEERIGSGEIDPRLEGIHNALAHAAKDPIGTGYATRSSHNSYMDILVNLGWLAFALAIVAIVRSALLVAGLGFQWFMFFAIGSAALLLHAFFEVQATPGQANFVPLLLWYALSRSRFVRDSGRGRRRRPVSFGER